MPWSSYLTRISAILYNATKQLSHPDVSNTVQCHEAAISPGCLQYCTIPWSCYLTRMSAILYNNMKQLSHPDDVWPEQCVIRMTYDASLSQSNMRWLLVEAICDTDDIRCHSKSSGWLNSWWYLIQLSNAVCHSDDIQCHSMSSGWLTSRCYLIRMIHNTPLCHPDDLPQGAISSGWYTTPLYVIRMTYLKVISHPNYIHNHL